ncbi:aminoglycoside phosphotransferase family protein [Candidatus Woesearchaeota archaeon]|nr:aminoglycoside phosphotransferase family protein [Candidatus Woesearchaeota archaeon]
MAATEQDMRKLEERLRVFSRPEQPETDPIFTPADTDEFFESYHTSDPEDAQDLPEGTSDSVDVKDTNQTGYELSDFLEERSTVFSMFSKTPEELKERHALKVALGRRAYNRFYKQTVYEAIKSAHKRGLIDLDTLKKCTETVEKDWRSIPVYETELNIRTRNSRLNRKLNNQGGMYKVEIFLPDGTQLTSFVKQYAKRDLFDRASEIQEYLSKLKQRRAARPEDTSFIFPTREEPLGLVAQPQYVDDKNMLVAEEFFEGKTLQERLEENPKGKMTLIREVIYNLALLSTEATKGVKVKDHYPQIPRDKKGRSPLRDINFGQNFTSQFLAQGKEYSGMRPGRRLDKIMQDPELRRLAELYESEIAGPLDSADKVFTHGDFHLDNILFVGERARFIDWESAKLTVPQYDLYRLMRRIDATPAEEKELVLYAFDTMHHMRTEMNMYKEMLGYKALGEDAKAEGLRTKIHELREQNKESKEQQREEFWQNYLRCRVHMDLERTVKEIEKTRGGKEHREEAVNFAAAAFRRALDAIENDELRHRLAYAASRLYGEDCPDLGKEVEYIIRRSATMQSAGTYTVMHLEDAFLKGEKRRRKVKRALKIGIPTAVTLTLLGFFGMKELDRRELQALAESDFSTYSAMVEMGDRPEPIVVDEEHHWTEDDYPLIFDPTEQTDETESELLHDFHMQDATRTRARIYGKAMYPACIGDVGFDLGQCGMRNYPVETYDSRFEHVNQDMIKALILTSEWMNARGIYGSWGDRNWPGSTPCNSPIIFYDGSRTTLTRCDQLTDPENNILYTYNRLEEMLSGGVQLEDAIARLYLGDSLVSLFKQLSEEDNYYRYSGYESRDMPFPQEARDFVGGFRVIYDRIRGQANDRR